jgi:SAM-dependent methyltransferase
VTEAEVHKIAAVELSHWWYVGTREACLSMLRPYLAGRRHRILDAGCGTGGNLLHLARFGDVQGIDLDPVCVDYCVRKGLNCRVGSLTALGVPREAFDLVTAFDALSQLAGADAEIALTGIADALVPGGLLAFREPAMRLAAGAHDRAVNVRHRFSRGEIVALLERVGLVPLRVTHLNTLLCPPIVLARRLGAILRPERVESDVQPAPAALNAALLAVLRVEKQLLRAIDLPFGVSVFAVARKP